MWGLNFFAKLLGKEDEVGKVDLAVVVKVGNG